jgi:hypothetical protein
MNTKFVVISPKKVDDSLKINIVWRIYAMQEL